MLAKKTNKQTVIEEEQGEKKTRSKNKSCILSNPAYNYSVRWAGVNRFIEIETHDLIPSKSRLMNYKMMFVCNLISRLKWAKQKKGNKTWSQHLMSWNELFAIISSPLHNPVFITTFTGHINQGENKIVFNVCLANEEEEEKTESE